MAIKRECHDCLHRLVDLTVDLAGGGPILQQRARETARDIIREEFRAEAIPALIATRFHRAIQELTGNPDPFSSRKKAETFFLRRMYDLISPNYQKDLDSLLSLAAVGNTIDFFKEKEDVTREMVSRISWAQADLAQFRQQLGPAGGIVLYLADNAGEQFFDRPLVTYLRRQGWKVIYMVKGGPIQNDLTRDDLYASGLGEALEPVGDTGARTVGLALAETGAAFQKFYGAANLILAKGMGHFETLSHLNDPRIFFLLQAKCSPVARALGVPHRSFVFRQLQTPES
jgi:damage-control phosphatase, subfamily I